VEACAALKNAYAMGIAFATGQHEAQGGQPGSIAMHNAESAVFAQAIFEMRRIVELMGGGIQAVLGLSGVGDLDVTTNGGRTGRFGKWLGTGLSRSAAIDKMEGATLECLEILEQLRKAVSAWQSANRVGSAELPLLRHMQAVALDGLPVDLPYAQFFQGLPAR
jgi:glycerol-3-phosphate dehydrogenase (NAD(P)+)